MTSNLLAQGFYHRLGFTHLEDLGDVVCLGRKL
jgi:ribosomal protein S18 acetylase RimI-like enzyme